MDIAQLPFDADTMLAGLRPWVEIESPTFDAARVNAMIDHVSRECALSGAPIERVAGPHGLRRLRARAASRIRARDEPGILIMGHLDTVHPIGTLGAAAVSPRRRPLLRARHLRHEGRQLPRARSDPPAAARWHAARAAGDVPVHQRRGGRQPVSTRDLIEAEAARHKYVLVPEPARADGGVVTGRYAIARFNLEASAGRAMPARGLQRDARRSASWPQDSRRSRR